MNEYDEELGRLSEAKLTLQTRKEKLIQQGHTNIGYDNRLLTTTHILEIANRAMENFDEGMVRQMVACITVLNRERLSVRFRDGTKIEQVIEGVGRVGA